MMKNVKIVHSTRTEKRIKIMKKKVLGMVLCTAMLLTACGSDSSSTATISTVDGTPISTEAASETTSEASAGTADGTEVTPLSTAIDTAALADGTYAVSFVASDASSENGTVQLNVTVYDYEHFSADAIENLKAGDTLVIDGNSMVVDTVEMNDSGLVTVNGGLEQGGCDLNKDEDGNYSEVLMDIGKNYTAVGQVTLPLSQDFVFTDNSDPEKQDVQYSAEELVTLLGDDTQYFDAMTTTATVADGQITAMTRIFMP